MVLAQRSPERSDVDLDWKSLYPWLNTRALADVPEPLRRDLESRAVDRFFVNWTLHSGSSAGHMDFLPALYHGSAADSTLWHAVRALAFADLKAPLSENVPYPVRARRSYGAALRGIRNSIANGEELATDGIFASLLLIDSFEVRLLVKALSMR